MAIPTDVTNQNKLLSLVSSFVKAGKAAVSPRASAWNEAERNRKAYIDLRVVDKKRKGEAYPDAGYPGTAPIVVPLTFAMNMTTLSYFMSIFTSRTPMIPIIGGGDDSEGARKMEAVLQYQTSYMGYILKLFTWLQDVMDYGVGVSYNYWREDEVNVVMDGNSIGMPGMVSKMMQALGMPGLPTKKIQQKVIAYEGNDMEVIDPFNLIIDPRVSLGCYEDGEFFGFSALVSMVKLKQLSLSNKIQNYDKIKPTTSSTATKNMSKRDSIVGVTRSPVVGGFGSVNISRVFVKLIPRDYGLSESGAIGMYEFWLSDCNVLIYADKVANIHEKFPVSIIEYNPDGHSLFNLGQSELLSGLQNHLSWLFNSHMDNVRKSLNDVVIVDPSMVNMRDLTDPKPGKIIRLNELAYGRDVRSIISQLEVRDITSGHLQKASVVVDFMQRVSAATDNMMGLPNFGRRTATEVRNMQVMAGGRMKMLAELFHSQGISRQHRQFITNTQQFLTVEKAYKIIGEQGGGYDKVAMVNPRDILGQFDIPPADGTIPTDRIALAETMKEVFNMMISSPMAPQLMQKFNMEGMFEYIISLMNVKDIGRFINQQGAVAPGVLPNDEIQNQVQQGNMVSMGSALGAVMPGMDYMGDNVNEATQNMVNDQYKM